MLYYAVSSKQFYICSMATILIIEDNQSCATLFKNFALYDAHRPILAANGHDGLAQWSNNAIDLVITDIDMPIMSGLDFLREINGKAKVVVITANKEKYATEAKSLGALEVLEKPLRYAQFKALIARHTEISLAN